MVMLLRRLMRIGFILSLLVVLATATSRDPQLAVARPYGTGGPDGAPNGSGDPTSDDVPSPTPKPTQLRSAQAGRTVTAVSTHGIRWNLVVSILIRLGIR